MNYIFPIFLLIFSINFFLKYRFLYKKKSKNNLVIMYLSLFIMVTSMLTIIAIFMKW